MLRRRRRCGVVWCACAGGLWTQSWEEQLLLLEQELAASMADWKVGRGPGRGQAGRAFAGKGGTAGAARLAAALLPASWPAGRRRLQQTPSPAEAPRPRREAPCSFQFHAFPWPYASAAPSFLPILTLPPPTRPILSLAPSTRPTLSMPPPALPQLAVGHHPTYSNGHHGNNSEVIAHLQPLFTKYGVQVRGGGYEGHSMPCKAGRAGAEGQGGKGGGAGRAEGARRAATRQPFPLVAGFRVRCAAGGPLGSASCPRWHPSR